MEKTVLNISGGKDSTAMYLYALEHLKDSFIPVFADTGNEHELTLEYVMRLGDRTGGPRVRWVKADFTERLKARKKYVSEHYDFQCAERVLDALASAGNNPPPFLAACLWKGMFPSNMIRFCTTELKVLPIQKIIYAPLLDNGHSIVSWQGVRAEESRSCSILPLSETIGERIKVYRPLLHWTVDDVFAMHKRHNLKPNPLYTMGMSRVGCMPCIMSRKKEIAAIIRRCPEHIDKVRHWERLVQRASKGGLATFFSCTKVPGTAKNRAQIDKVVLWAQKQKTRPMQAVLPLEPLSCRPEYGLCE